MFTGIVETTATIKEISCNGSNKTFIIESPISKELKIDQSVSHSGVCLTIEKITGNKHQVTAIEETLNKSNLANWQVGQIVNLERCMQMNGRIDGHIVQGHVDGTATCISANEKNGSIEYEFKINKKFAALIIEKGSISLNGISLTIFNVGDDLFKVAIIPYTFEHTNIKYINPGDKANVEFDIIGKYILRNNRLGGY